MRANMLVALFGITNEGLSLFVNLVSSSWWSSGSRLIAWTFLDARRRIAIRSWSPAPRAPRCSRTSGTVVYTILRPPEFLEDAR